MIHFLHAFVSSLDLSFAELCSNYWDFGNLPPFTLSATGALICVAPAALGGQALQTPEPQQEDQPRNVVNANNRATSKTFSGKRRIINDMQRKNERREEREERERETRKRTTITMKRRRKRKKQLSKRKKRKTNLRGSSDARRLVSRESFIMKRAAERQLPFTRRVVCHQCVY